MRSMSCSKSGPHLVQAGGVEDVDGQRTLLELDLDAAVAQPAGLELRAELLARPLPPFDLVGLGGGGVTDREKLVQYAIFGGPRGPVADVAGGLLAFEHDRPFDQVADNAVHVPADVAHLGELRGFHLDERRVHELGQPPGDLGLANARGADHEDVLGEHVFAQLIGQIEPPPAIANRDGDRALGLILANDVAIEGLDDLSGGHVAHG